MSKRALLLVDLQVDYLHAANLSPSADTLLGRIAALRTVCGTVGIPVIHSHTRIKPDGSDRMPHLREHGIWWCVANSPGAMAPLQAAPTHDEPIFYKTVYNALADPALERHLRAIGIDELVIAGVHLHACVRETALAAYQAGYCVSIAEDAVATYDQLHGEITREYLSKRGISFAPGLNLLAAANGTSIPANMEATPAPSAYINGRWRTVTGQSKWLRRNPACWSQVIDEIAPASDEQIDEAARLAASAQHEWISRSPEERNDRLTAFVNAIAARRRELVDAIITEVGKPRRDADAEVGRTLELGHLALQYFSQPAAWTTCADGVRARRVPLGPIAAITPFNHPLAIAIGKLMPALTLGNSVLWKPALAAAATTRLVVEAAETAGFPSGLLAVLFGDGHTALRLSRHPLVAGVSVTASSTAGRQLALVCAEHLKPLQAELGGNNAVVIMANANIHDIAADIARSAFGFAGQRCTASRRILADISCLPALSDALVKESRALHIDSPTLAHTDLGPVISREKQAQVDALVTSAFQQGAAILYGGVKDPNDRLPADGCWYAPTLLTGIPADSTIWKQETFGPVALLHGFEVIDEAIALVNSVPQGLIATLYGGDADERKIFLDRVQVGVVKFDQAPAGTHAEAPFGGWKDSGFGPPEHGPWDEAFYTRIQAVYGY